jgi:hypothetical protein
VFLLSIRVFTSMANHAHAVVVDNGCVSFKAGFAGHDGPRIEYPSVVGRHRDGSRAMREWHIGNKALRNREIFTLKYPLHRGIVTNWYEMEMVSVNCRRELDISVIVSLFVFLALALCLLRWVDNSTGRPLLPFHRSSFHAQGKPRADG